MNRAPLLTLLGCALAAGLVSCGGGGGTATVTPVTPPAAPTAGFAVPSEISPVSTVQAAGSIQKALARVVGASAAPVAADTAGQAAGTDYSDAATSRYVTEHAIDQFAIIETILNAIEQTHYADADNINHGAYKSLVTWQEASKGSNSISIQTWVVDSQMVKENGADVNLVTAWIEDPGQPIGQPIKALFRITASATKRADGSYQDYGKWTLNVKFDDPGTTYFEAKADIAPTGETILTINNHENHGGQLYLRQGKVVKGDLTGYGKVTYTPDGNGNGPQAPVTAAYAYNAAQLRVDDGSSDSYKDRTATVDLVQQYGMFDSVSGDDVLKTHSFGFPVSSLGVDPPFQAYYGAWQGRHNLWMPDGTVIPDGTRVARADQNGSGAVYLTASFPGVLTKRTLAPGDINDLLNLPVNTWANFQYQLQWDGSQWLSNGAAFGDWLNLVAMPGLSVFINRWDNQLQMPRNYVYDPAGPSGAGFYLAQGGPNGTWTSTGTRYVPALNDNLNINVGGNIYIQYTGSGWVKKTVLGFDQQTNTPTFAANGDSAYSLTTGFHYYVNTQGCNEIVTRTGPSSYDVQKEIQKAANPDNLAEVLSVGGTAVASFQGQTFNGGAQGQASTYTFVPGTLKLVYATVGTVDAALSPEPSPGDPVTTSLSSLTAFDAGGTSLQTQYNWDYPSQGQNWGVQTFLYTENASHQRTYHLLDDPIALARLSLTTLGGASRTLALQFDGWMQGLPQFDNELAQNHWTMTDDLAEKIIDIPAGTVAVDALDPSVSYLIKPLQVGVYLKPALVPDAMLDLGAANAINLGDPSVLPQYSDNGVGLEPSGLPVKYSSGVLVSQ